jgi:hypothetical protein
MDLFNIIVLSTAIVILVIILTYIGIKLSSKSDTKNAYPPQSASCPDYWQTVTTDPSSCMIPLKTAKNTGKIYNAEGILTLNPSTTYGLNNNSINFSEAGWTRGGINSICSKKAWANQNSILWDGVSNYNSC